MSASRNCSKRRTAEWRIRLARRGRRASVTGRRLAFSCRGGRASKCEHGAHLQSQVLRRSARANRDDLGLTKDQICDDEKIEHRLTPDPPALPDDDRRVHDSSACCERIERRVIEDARNGAVDANPTSRVLGVDAKGLDELEMVLSSTAASGSSTHIAQAAGAADPVEVVTRSAAIRVRHLKSRRELGMSLTDFRRL